MRRAFTLQMQTRMGYDLVRCHLCRQIWYTGNRPDELGCPRCGNQGWWTITDNCEKCGGYAKLRPDPAYRECVECQHLQRTDVVPEGLREAGHGAGRIAVEARDHIDPGDPVVATRDGFVATRTDPDDTIIGTAVTRAKRGELVEVQLTQQLVSPTGDDS